MIFSLKQVKDMQVNQKRQGSILEDTEDMHRSISTITSGLKGDSLSARRIVSSPLILHTKNDW